MNADPATPAPTEHLDALGRAGWRGRLELHARMRDGRCVVHDRHDGPLRVLKRLYPEGPGICHQVLVHPPGGLVGGDRLDVHLQAEPGAHALLTTAGAARFYRSDGEPAVQDVRLHAEAGARIEWLPLETIAYDGCLALNRLRFALEPGAEMIGWDLLALGLPAASQPFHRGRFDQHLEWPGHWLERGRIDGTDRRLLDSPLGFGGLRAAATLWFAAGEELLPTRRDALLDAARALDADGTLVRGATAPNRHLVVLRALAPRVEPAFVLLREAWAAWRRVAWGLDAPPPRIWRT